MHYCTYSYYSVSQFLLLDGSSNLKAAAGCKKNAFYIAFDTIYVSCIRDSILHNRVSLFSGMERWNDHAHRACSVTTYTDNITQ